MDGAHSPIQGVTLAKIKMSGVSGVTTFASIHHPCGRQPLALFKFCTCSLFGHVVHVNGGTF